MQCIADAAAQSQEADGCASPSRQEVDVRIARLHRLLTSPAAVPDPDADFGRLISLKTEVGLRLQTLMAHTPAIDDSQQQQHRFVGAQTRATLALIQVNRLRFEPLLQSLPGGGRLDVLIRYDTASKSQPRTSNDHWRLLNVLPVTAAPAAGAPQQQVRASPPPPPPPPPKKKTNKQTQIDLPRPRTAMPVAGRRREERGADGWVITSSRWVNNVQPLSAVRPPRRPFMRGPFFFALEQEYAEQRAPPGQIKIVRKTVVGSWKFKTWYLHRLLDVRARRPSGQFW